MTEKLCIIGTGLIGCSLAAALKQAGFDGHIVGNARHRRTLDIAVSRGYLDSADTDPARCVDGADMVMLTVPMLAMPVVLEQIAPHLGPDTVITDGGSVKGRYIRQAREILTNLSNFVPGHPIAGREKSGVDAADAALFRNRKVLLTPVEASSRRAVQAVTDLWQMTGAEVEVMDPATHDRVLAATSHLPHMLAYSLVDYLATRHEHEDIFRYAAGGFRDFTRIASSDPTMWRDVCLTNRDEISLAMQGLIDNMSQLKLLVDDLDGDALFELFAKARDARDRHTGEPGVSDRPSQESGT